MSTIHSSSNGSGRNGAKRANGAKHNGKAHAGNTKSAVRRNYISLFSGGMGLDIGLERAGFNCVVANEINALV